MLTIDANVWIVAVDNSDIFHTPSRTFVLAVAERGVQIYVPAFARTEIACALARRWQNAETGERLSDALLNDTYVTLVPLDPQFLLYATRLGIHYYLRAADALYVATAQLHQSRLISWDNELIQRVDAITPDQWLTSSLNRN